MSKTLILIRHGHRDTTNRELDNGLSEKGRTQAKAIAKFFERRFGLDLEKGLWVVSSPKLRCVETLLPLAKAAGRKVDIHPDLDEQGLREAGGSFAGRIQRFLNEWKNAKADLTVLCSHGDWLPAATQHLLGAAQAFKKGGWMEIELEADHSALKWYVPTFKPFY